MEYASPTARLNFTLIFSVLVHLVIILGIGFTVSSPPNNPPLTNLDITLVKQQSELEPEDADFFAQANNEGGGDNSKQKTANPTIDSRKDDAKTVKSAKARPAPAPQLATPTPPMPVEASNKLLTQANAERKVTIPQETAEKIKPVTEVAPPKRPNISASELILRARDELKQIEKDTDMSTRSFNNAPRKRILSSRTKQYAAAAYHEAWRRKVERLGNMNFPKEVQKRQLNGSLLLSVMIKPDGSVPVDGIALLRSSGNDILDNAAIRIVRLGAPYAPIPEDVLQGSDVVEIIRTWKFETDFGLE